MHSPLKRITFSVVLLVIVLLVCELSAKAVVHLALKIPDHQYTKYYRDDPNLALLTWTMAYQQHPFFAYESARVRELEKLLGQSGGNDKFVIGVFGGSVAQQFGNYARQNPQQFSRLREVVPSVGDRQIQIADFGMGGGRQPQQFIMSAFFIDRLDMIINLDGFNEVRFRPLLPVYPLEFPELSLKFYNRADGGTIYSVIGRVGRWVYRTMNGVALRVPGVSRSSLYFAVWKVARGGLYRSVRWAEQEYYKATVGKEQSAAGSEISPSELLNEQLKIWAKYTILQHEVATAFNKPVFFFLQPNQYLEGSKQLSDDELSRAFDKGRAQEVHEKMLALRARVAALQAAGLPAFDLTQVYSDVHDAIYVDTCCHVNERGNAIMAEAIVAAIGAATEGHRVAASGPEQRARWLNKAQ